jgi:hypothetical protein
MALQNETRQDSLYKSMSYVREILQNLTFLLFIAKVGLCGLIPCEPSRFIAEMGEDSRFSGGKADAVPDKAAGAARLDAPQAMLKQKAE